MREKYIQSKVLNALHKISGISWRKKIVFVIVVSIIIFIVIFFSVIFTKKNNTSLIKKEDVKPDTTSKISISTNSLTITEWGLEIPINGNILGKVTYSSSDNNMKIVFSSSKLNNIDLSSIRCKELGITKDSWGFKRSPKKANYEQGKRPMIIGNYEYYRDFPVSVCSNVSEIDAAFNYSYIHLKEKK